MKTLTSPSRFTMRWAWPFLLSLGLVAYAADHERPQPPPTPRPPAEGGLVPRPERRDPALNRREAAEAEEMLRRMDAEIKELRRVGDHEAADRLERRRQQVKERLALEREPRDALAPMAPAEGGPRPPLEPERRQQMVRMAVENLRAAGYPELAEMVAREIRERDDRPGPGGPWGRGPMDDGMGPVDRTERLERAIMDMQRVLRELERRLRALER